MLIQEMNAVRVQIQCVCWYKILDVLMFSNCLSKNIVLEPGFDFRMRTRSLPLKTKKIITVRRVWIAFDIAEKGGSHITENLTGTSLPLYSIFADCMDMKKVPIYMG